MRLVKYDPKFKFPIFIHGAGERIQSMSVNDARQLHKELGKALKKIPPEEHEDIQFGLVKKDKEKK
ncbi:hypothetical protein KA005_67890 [bacterium]|nr:hypothetical protein [bacterium]